VWLCSFWLLLLPVKPTWPGLENQARLADTGA
jgi:hypothetical protein